MAPSGWVGLAGHTISSTLGSEAGSSALVTSLGHGAVPGVRCNPPLIPPRSSLNDSEELAALCYSLGWWGHSGDLGDELLAPAPNPSSFLFRT